jgi:hypothetical protein
MFSTSDEDSIRSHIFHKSNIFFSTNEINEFEKEVFIPILLNEILKVY